MRFSSQTDIERRKSKLVEVLGELPSEIKKEQPQTAILNSHPPIWIYGKPGKGKTTVAHLMAIKELDDSMSISDNGRIELKSPPPEPFMAGNLCREFQDRSLSNRDYEPGDFLYLIDDIDKLKMSDFREEQLFIFFDRCLKLKRKLIVTSQKNMREFSEMFSGDFVGAVNRRLAAIFNEVEL